MSNIMSFEEYSNNSLDELKTIKESRTSKGGMKDIKDHKLYFVIRIELVKLSRTNKHAEYSRLYIALEKSDIVSCIRKSDNRLYELPHGVYVRPDDGSINLGKLETKVTEILSECLTPLYPNTFKEKYTTLISGPAQVTFKNLDEIVLDIED